MKNILIFSNILHLI